MRIVVLLVIAACGPSPKDRSDAAVEIDAAAACSCSVDGASVLDCDGNTVAACDGVTACDPATLACTNACAIAETSRRSIGCDYYATSMDIFEHGNCFAAFVVNSSRAPAHLEVKRAGATLDVAAFTRLPVGSGPALTYDPYDAAGGLAPGQVAVMFLGGGNGAAPLCPVASAAAVASFVGTGIGESFEIASDVPVVAYQINPYGGGASDVAAASLLLPTSVWDTSYIAVDVAPAGDANFSPSLNIVAREDGTIATLVPKVAVVGGNGIPAGAANVPLSITLAKGQHAQITQLAELTGSVLTANKPIGFMAGQPCFNMPLAESFCDHGEQMLPPVRALGSRYVGVMYRPRVPAETKTFWRVVGAVDGTQLTYSTAVGGPATLARGEAVLFETGTPFVVTSQDAAHPFMLFTYMTGSTHVASGFGDPDFVVSVPPEQYLDHYVFFADPTYPETNLVVVRSRGTDGQFHDVSLDCAGVLGGWTAVGDFEFTRADLITGDFVNVGTCSTGRREITSTAPFGLWVWGWGTPNTSTLTRNVSYGYPGGMDVKPINNVIL
ncbi:MAG: IgGFc-binding protein [Kofleriaceae bacterium]